MIFFFFFFGQVEKRMKREVGDPKSALTGKQICAPLETPGCFFVILEAQTVIVGSLGKKDCSFRISFSKVCNLLFSTVQFDIRIILHLPFAKIVNLFIYFSFSSSSNKNLKMPSTPTERETSLSSNGDYDPRSPS